jgi:hypothetical protein
MSDQNERFMKRTRNYVLVITFLMGGLYPTLCCSKDVPDIKDVLIFGDAVSERQHHLEPGRSETIQGGLGEPARRLLPLEVASWEGGQMAFTLKIDPERQNYVTIRLWGSDVTGNRLILYCEGKQIGYRHLGDIDILDFGTLEPAYNGRFYYNTSPLPPAMTRGRTELRIEIRSTGSIWGYGETFEQYQKTMTQPTRGIYRIYTHTDGYFVPCADEKQGNASANPPMRKEPGPEVLDELKQRVNREITEYLKLKQPLNQMQLQFLASAYRTKWTAAYQNPKVIERVIEGVDNLYVEFKWNRRVAEAGPASYNPDWFGLGPVGDSVRLLAKELAGKLDEKLPDGVTRRVAWSEMLCYSCDWHRHHRRLYTNQSIINDLYGIYLCNRGVAVVEPAKAVPEPEIRRYLYESVGLEPWRDSDSNGEMRVETVDRNWGVSSDYYQLTRNGLTRELGYVGNYGEVLDWATTLYNATRPELGKPGDERIRQQLIKIALARAAFRYSMLDSEGNRAMRLETIVGWRDAYYPGDVVYGQRSAWDASSLQCAAVTLNPYLIGYAQQMLDDNQFFSSVRERMKTGGIRVTAGLLAVPDEYELLKSQRRSPHRLPMTPGQPDFVFTDEEDGVVALKHGDEILYASLYWRARNAINFLARVHYITPRFDRIAVVRQETEYEASGMTYKRPDWTNFGFGNGGLRYPGDLHSAHAGEELPIAKIPEGIRFRPGEENVYAGKGTFYTLRYGPYLIGMNCTKDKTYQLRIPEGYPQTMELVSGKIIAPNKTLNVPPLSTVVLYLDE